MHIQCIIIMGVCVGGGGGEGVHWLDQVTRILYGGFSSLVKPSNMYINHMGGGGGGGQCIGKAEYHVYYMGGSVHW